MRRVLAIVFGSTLMLALTASAALAVTPTDVTRTGGLHFVGNPNVTATKTSTTAFLTATGEVAGAGSTGGTAELSADVEVVRGCINRGSQGQQPSGLQRSFETTTGTVEFDTTRQGRGTFTVSTEPVDVSGFTCPDQMVPVLVSATFTNITLTVTSQPGAKPVPAMGTSLPGAYSGSGTERNSVPVGAHGVPEGALLPSEVEVRAASAPVLPPSSASADVAKRLVRTKTSPRTTILRP